MRIDAVNGGPGLVLDSPAGPISALLVDLDPDTGLIAVLRLVGNPDKLGGLAPS